MNPHMNFLIGFILILAPSVLAQTELDKFCALEVALEWPFGADMSSVQVAMFNSDGRKVAESAVEAGKARICDFPEGKHYIRVDARGCHSVKIEQIELIVAVPQSVRVYLNRRIAFQAHGGTICGGFLRVVRTDGVGIPGSTISVDGTGEEATTDQYGRAFVGVPIGGDTNIIATAPGYLKNQLVLSCSDPGVTVSGVIRLQAVE